MRTRLLLPVALAALLAPAAADARRIGGSLKASANSRFACDVMPGTGAYGERFPLPTGVSSCTYLAAGSLRNWRMQVAAPSTGVAERVRVKVGPRTGRMRVTVLRALRSTIAGFACCFHQGQSRVFTPAPNSVTTVAVRLPMVATFDEDPKVGEAVDRLALTVLDPGVPVPAHDYKAAGDINKPGSLAFFPHVRPGDVRVDGAGLGAISPLLTADFEGEPREEDVPQPAPAPLPNPVPGAAELALPLRCSLTVGCTTFLPTRALILPTV